MNNSKYSEEFKFDAVHRVNDGEGSVSKVANRLGCSVATLYIWMKNYSPNILNHNEEKIKKAKLENLALKGEIKKFRIEKDVLTNVARHFFKNPEQKYIFILQQRKHHSVRQLCRVLSVSSTGYYVWLKHLKSKTSINEC